MSKVYNKALTLGLETGDQIEIFMETHDQGKTLIGRLRYFDSMDNRRITVGENIDCSGHSEPQNTLSWNKVFDIYLREKFDSAKYRVETHES